MAYRAASCNSKIGKAAMGQNLKTTGSLARECGVSESAIRNYANTGVVPSTRDAAGRRLFTEPDSRALKQLLAAGNGRIRRK